MFDVCLFTLIHFSHRVSNILLLFCLRVFWYRCKPSQFSHQYLVQLLLLYTRLKQHQNNTQLLFVQKIKHEIQCVLFYSSCSVLLMSFQCAYRQSSMDSFLFTNTSFSASISTVILRLLDQHENETELDIYWHTFDGLWVLKLCIRLTDLHTNTVECLIVFMDWSFESIAFFRFFYSIFFSSQYYYLKIHNTVSNRNKSFLCVLMDQCLKYAKCWSDSCFYKVAISNLPLKCTNLVHFIGGVQRRHLWRSPWTPFYFFILRLSTRESGTFERQFQQIRKCSNFLLSNVFELSRSANFC